MGITASGGRLMTAPEEAGKGENAALSGNAKPEGAEGGDAQAAAEISAGEHDPAA